MIKVLELFVDAFVDRFRVFMTFEVEDLFVVKLGSELFDCVYM